MKSYSIQDLIDEGYYKPDDFQYPACSKIARTGLTSLKGIENFKKLVDLNAKINYLTNLKELKGLELCKTLKILNVSENELETLEGIEELKNLEELNCLDNYNLKNLVGIQDLDKLVRIYTNLPRYKNKTVEQIKEIVKIEAHLKPGDDRRGAASISDTGLFDFKMTK